jgi:hypothetical protein
MSMHFLTTTANPTSTWVTSQPLPKDVRAFGKYPNTNDWKRGDLLLVSAESQSPTQKTIAAFQHTGGYDDFDAQWHHVAMYAGGEHICEAGVNGVVYRPLYEYVGKHKLRLRRDPLLTDEQRVDVVISAIARLGQGYAFSRIVELAKSALSGFWNNQYPPTPDVESRCICSTLCADAHALVSGRLLARNPPKGLVTPAAISASDKMEDVFLYWRVITRA